MQGYVRRDHSDDGTASVPQTSQRSRARWQTWHATLVAGGSFSSRYRSAAVVGDRVLDPAAMSSAIPAPLRCSQMHVSRLLTQSLETLRIELGKTT
jgi:hypothetical protein